jgi:hypothetical protein
MPELRRELVLKFPTPNTVSSRTISKRISSLKHELGDDSVEDHALIVPAPSVSYEVLDRLRCLLREEPDVNVAKRRVDSGGVSEWRMLRLGWARGRSNSTFIEGRPFVEDIAVSGLLVSVIIHQLLDAMRTGEIISYSGSERVNM